MKIVAIVLLANFALTNLAFAQGGTGVPTIPTTPGLPPGPLPGTPVPAPTAPAPAAPTNPNDEVVITPKDLKDAQASVDACYQFSYNKLAKVTLGNFKALWPAKWKNNGFGTFSPTNEPEDPGSLTFGGKAKCLIVPGSAPTVKDNLGRNILYSGYSQPAGSASLQATLENVNNKGLSQRDFTKAYLADLEAKNEANWFSKLVGATINAILSVVTFFVGMLTFMAGAIFNTAVSWVLNQTIPDIVTVGWGIVRDFANMFFILILIIIALAAILRIESYDYRHLLGELVIMAILVNFSKVIAVTLIHFVDLISIMFAPRDLTEIFAFVYNFTIGDIGVPNGWMSGLLQGITKLFFAVISLATFLALTGLLIVRLVGLYVLIIFSPLAYVLDILPATKHYAHEWWEYFAKYLIWVPISFFMLRLTILLVRAPFPNSDTAFQYVILMAFMWGAVIVAEHAGMVGGKAIVNGIEKAGHKGAHFLGHVAAGAAGKWWNEKYMHKYAEAEAHAKSHGRDLTMGEKLKLAAFNPVATTKAWMEHSHEQQHIAQEGAKAASREVVNQARTGGVQLTSRGLKINPTGGVQMPYREFLAKKEEREYVKLFLDMARQKKAQVAAQLAKDDTHKGAIMRRSLIMAAAADNHFEDIIDLAPGFAEKYSDENGSVSSTKAISAFIHDFLRADPDDHHADRDSQRFIGSDLNEILVQKGRYLDSGIGVLDPATGNYVRGLKKSGKKIKNKFEEDIDELVDNGQMDHALTEWRKLSGRKRAEASVFNTSDYVYDVEIDQATGKRTKVNGRWVSGLNEAKVEAAKLMKEDTRREVQHMAARNVEALIPGSVPKDANGIFNPGVIEVEHQDQAEAIERFWKTNQHQFAAVYAKKLDMSKPGEIDSSRVTGVTVQYKDKHTGKTGTIRLGDPSKLKYDPVKNSFEDPSGSKPSGGGTAPGGTGPAVNMGPRPGSPSAPPPTIP